MKILSESGGKPLSVSGEDGIAVLEMALAIYVSQVEGRLVSWPIKSRKHPLE